MGNARQPDATNNLSDLTVSQRHFSPLMGEKEETKENSRENGALFDPVFFFPPFPVFCGSRARLVYMRGCVLLRVSSPVTRADLT